MSSMMTKEEAKAYLADANRLVGEGRHKEALDLLETIQQAFPDSGRVAQQRVQCLIALNRLDEAETACAGLERLAGTDVASVKAQLAAARAGRPAPPAAGGPANASHAPASRPAPGTAPPAVDAPSAENEFFVENVSPVSTEETCVMGHVTAGAFFSGSTVSVMTPDGVPLLAPILRLGTQAAPLNVVRKGPMATMQLQIEAQYVMVGSKITSSDSGAAYAPTMIVGQGIGPATPPPETTHPRLREAQRFIDQRSFPAAKEILDKFLAEHANSFEVYRLLARLALEAEHELHDPKLAMQHIAKAYEIGGHDRPEVIEVLAQALGANGQQEHGLRHLERLYETALDNEKKELYGRRINAYRSRYKMPDLWQFIDGFGAVIFESTDPEQVKKAIASRNIPENAMCRKNKVGTLIPVKEWAQSVSIPPSAASPRSTAKAPARTPSDTPDNVPRPRSAALDATIGGLAGAIASILLSIALGLSPTASVSATTIAEAVGLLVLGTALGSLIGWNIGRKRQERP